MIRALLLSNSTGPGQGYLSHATEWIKDFLAETDGYAAFIPFAGVTISQDSYTEKVKDALAELEMDIVRVSLEDQVAAKKVLEDCSVILVGGGNTFHLLHAIRKLDLFNLIKDKVASGTKYIGWSAGSNVAGLSIRTTNDMPIIEPKSFTGFGFFPYQINPHYTEATLEGHGGESRKDRLAEFIVLTGEPVLCLPEGTALEISGSSVNYLGNQSGIWMNPEGNVSVHSKNINDVISL